jgi:hypothetical protein
MSWDLTTSRSTFSDSPEPPSFEPWLSRVRLIRAWAATTGLVIVGSLSYLNGTELSDAIVRGMIVAIVAYFVAWGSALWICSELYFAQIGRIRKRLAEREAERVTQLQEMYRARLEANGIDVSNDPFAGTAPLTPADIEQNQKRAA